MNKTKEASTGETKQNEESNETAIEEYGEIKEDKKYSVYDYVKQHPAIFVTGVSALIAIITYVFNAALYNKERRYLYYWGFDSDAIQIVDHEQKYVLIASLVFYLITVLLQQLLMDSLEVYRQNIKFHLWPQQLSRWELKNARKKEFDFWVKIIFEKVSGVFVKDKTALRLRREQLEEEREINLKKIAEIVEKLEAAKKVKPKIILPLMVIMVIVFFLTSLMLAIINGFSEKMNYMMVWPVILISLLVVMGQYLIFYFTKIAHVKKAIKNTIRKDENEGRKIVCEYTMEEVKRYPIFRLKELSLKKIFSNNNIVYIVITMIVLLLYVFFTVSYDTRDITDDRTQFAIAKIEEREYAIIYISENTYYLDEVEISGDTIYVYTNKQRILKTDDLCYDIIVFDSIMVYPKEK